MLHISIVHRVSYRIFSLGGGGGGGDVVCGLTGMSEYFSHHAQNGAKSIVVSFC